MCVCVQANVRPSCNVSPPMAHQHHCHPQTSPPSCACSQWHPRFFQNSQTSPSTLLHTSTSPQLSSLNICLLKSKTYPNEQETIENEFHMAIAAEKSTSANAAAAAATSAAATSAGTATSASAASPRATSRPASTIMLEEGLGDGGAGVQPRGTIRRQPTVETKLNESGLMETSFVSSLRVGNDDTATSRGEVEASDKDTLPIILC